MRGLEDTILAQLSGAPVAALATMEGGHPWVRYMFIRTSNDMIIRSHTKLISRKVAAIMSNPHVHLCVGHSELVRNNPYLQIQAVAKVTTSKKERHLFWKDSMKSIYTGPDDPSYAIVIMLPIRIEYWSIKQADPAIWKIADSLEVDQFISGTHPMLTSL